MDEKRYPEIPGGDELINSLQDLQAVMNDLKAALEDHYQKQCRAVEGIKELKRLFGETYPNGSNR